jgi:hypothetical protein
MVWLITKEDYKVGERYVSFMIYYFIFHLIVRAITGGSETSAFSTGADNLVDWLGMPKGFAEVIVIFVVGTLIFPPILLWQLCEINNKRKAERPDDDLARQTNGSAYSLGRFIGWILSKWKRQ